MTYLDRMTILVNSYEGDAKAEPLRSAHQAEMALLKATEAHAPRDAQHQKDLIGLLKALDEGFLPEYEIGKSERMQAAYAKLEAVPADFFWKTGFPKLQELRATLWTQENATQPQL